MFGIHEYTVMAQAVIYDFWTRLLLRFPVDGRHDHLGTENIKFLFEIILFFILN